MQFYHSKIRTEWIKTRRILTRNKNLPISHLSQYEIGMFGVELGKKIVKEENGLFIPLRFDKSDR